MTEASSDPTLPDPALAAEGSAPAGPSAEAVVAPTDTAESLAPHAEPIPVDSGEGVDKDN